ncbi:MAG: VWA domain-containing protein [Planctomycetota bacterium]|nr:MAG: VWA domain-containing protein [Planctomycetota bacterium]
MPLLPAFLLLLPLLPAAQEPAAGAPLAERVAEVERLLEAGESGGRLGAALHAIANLKSEGAVRALADLLPRLEGLGRAAAIQALGMCDHPAALEELHRVARESKSMPDRTMAVRVLAGEKDVEWLLGFFKKEKNGVIRARILEELLRVQAEGLDELVLRSARDKSGEVRAAAMKGIADLRLAKGGRLAVKTLKDSSLAARVAACRAAALTGGVTAFRTMVAELQKTKNRTFRAALTEGLALAATAEEMAPIITAAGREKDPEVIACLAVALGEAAGRAPAACAEILVKLAGSQSPQVRENAIRGLAAARPAGIQSLLADLLEHESPVTRADAAWALAEMGELEPEAEARLLPLLGADSLSLRLNATRALAGAAGEEAVAALRGMLDDMSWSVRSAAVAALRRHRDREVVGALIARMEVEDSRVFDEIADALGELTGETFGANVGSWRHWFDDLPADWRPPAPEEARRRLAAAAAARTGRPGETVTDYHGIPIPRGGVVFILDVSGSMNEVWDERGTEPVTRFQHFSQVLKNALANLPATTRFDLVLFSSSAHAWRPRLVSGSNENIEEARRYLDNMGAFGGTNLFGALELALSIPDAQTVFLLTDGEPTVGVTLPDAIVRKIARLNRDKRVIIHTLAAGEASAEFLADLAAANGGRMVDLR